MVSSKCIRVCQGSQHSLFYSRHTHIKKQLLEFALEKKEASDDEYLIDLPHAAGTERDVGLQAALDAAEAVLAELNSSFPDKQYQLMLASAHRPLPGARVDQVSAHLNRRMTPDLLR